MDYSSWSIKTLIKQNRWWGNKEIYWKDQNAVLKQWILQESYTKLWAQAHKAIMFFSIGYVLARELLDRLEEFKYLGLWIGFQLTLKPYINAVIKKINCNFYTAQSTFLLYRSGTELIHSSCSKF